MGLRLCVQATNEKTSVAAQMRSIPVAFINRLLPKSRARTCMEIATRKYSPKHAEVTSPSPGIQIPAIRPAAAANLIAGISRQYLRGHRTSVKHRAMNAIGLMQMMPSPTQISAKTITGQMGSGSSDMTKPYHTVWYG